MISVDLPGRKVYAKVWRIQVGRIPLYLMDTDVEPNTPDDRVLSARLYGGDHEMRIAQEIMLGIGGVRALRALGLDPMVWHMNEGHAAFLALERCRELVQGMDIGFEVAREIAAANAIFTTHTPVAAGNDAFNFELVDTYFGDYWPQLRLDRDQFHDLAREENGWGVGFSMTVLALRLSVAAQRRQPAARRCLAPDVAVPLARTGRGRDADQLHHQWRAYRHLASAAIDDLYLRYLGADWYAHLDEPARWDHVREIPDDELWARSWPAQGGSASPMRRQRLAAPTANAWARGRRRSIRETHALLNPQRADAWLRPALRHL